MSIQIDIMTNHIGVLEGVDPYEASTRVSALLTQVETAYAMTARIQKLSLLKYLPLMYGLDSRCASSASTNAASSRRSESTERQRMYQFSYAEVLDETPQGRARARAPGHRALDRAAAGGREGRRATRARRSRPCCSCGGLWGFLIEDLAKARERSAAGRCAPT